MSSWKGAARKCWTARSAPCPPQIPGAEVDHLLALLLRTHDRGNFGLISARIIWMEGAWPEPDAVAPPCRTISGSSSTRESMEGTTMP